MLRFDGLVVAEPESIFYWTGLDHQGFVALRLLIIDDAGEMMRIARAMEVGSRAGRQPGDAGTIELGCSGSGLREYEVTLAVLDRRDRRSAVERMPGNHHRCPT